MKIQLKRSNVLNGDVAKEPTATQMEYGELAVNYSDGDPAIFLKDSTNKVIRIAGKGATGLDGDYVNITGDNMTGNLTLGTDKVVLNATDGTANFAGDVTITDGTNSRHELKVLDVGGATGALHDIRSASGFPGANSAIRIINGNDQNIKLAYDGSSEFAGDLTVNSYSDGCVLFSNGGATFSGGSVAVNGNTGDFSFAGQTSNVGVLKGTGDINLGLGKILLNADGSATFAGDLRSATRVIGGVDTNGTTTTGIAGSFYSINTSANDPVLYIQNKTASSGLLVAARSGATGENLVYTLKNNGNATFAGGITANSFIGDGSGLTGLTSGVQDGTTSQKGIVQLSTSTSSTSTTLAATPSAVKGAYDRGSLGVTNAATAQSAANAAQGTANAALPKSGGTISGNLTVTGDIQSNSDIALKRDISSIENALSRLLNIDGVSWAWKETGSRSCGVIAQTIEKEFPELVKTTDAKSVNYNGLIGVLIEAVKELKTEVEELKSHL